MTRGGACVARPRVARPRVARPRVARLVVAAIAAAALAAICVIAEVTPSTTSGYIASVLNSADTAATAQNFSCTAAEQADRTGGIFLWYLNEASNSLTASDYQTTVAGLAAGTNAGAYQGSMTTSTTAPLACSRDTGGAYVLNGSMSYVSSTLTSANPTSYSVEVWFKTTVAGGKLIGLGSSKTGLSASYDRHLYIESTGKLDFGSYNGVTQVVTSAAVVTDGKWHHAVGTQSPATGMLLYLDGALVASNAAFTTPQNFTGYWRVGYDSLASWPNAPANSFFTGQMRYAAAYSVVLTATQVKNHWAAGQ